MLKIVLDKGIGCHTRRIVDEVMTAEDVRPVMWICPEFSKASVERAVMMKKIEVDGKMNCSVDTGDGLAVSVIASLTEGDVVSFMKLASTVLTICGRDFTGAGNKTALRTAIYKIISEHISEFKTFGKLVGRVEFIDLLINLIDDFTRYGIGEEHIARALEDYEGEECAYSSKLQDFKLITGYLNDLNREYDLKLMSDPIVEASALLKLIASDRDMLSKRRFSSLRKLLTYRFEVLGFGAIRLLTPQELKFVGLLSELGAEITFYPLYNGDGSDEALYYFGNRFVDNLTGTGAEYEIIEREEEPDTDGDDVIRKASLMYAHEEEPDPNKEIKTDNIVSIALTQADDRVAYIANEIIRLTREEGLRYRDIRIVCIDEEYETRLKEVMKEFGLDSFIDRETMLTNTPVFRYLSLLLELPIRNFELQTVLKIMRTGLVSILPDIVDSFENYCIGAGIMDGRRMFDSDFYVSRGKYYSSVTIDGKDLPLAEYLWENVVERVLMPLHDISLEINNAGMISEKADLCARHIDSLNLYIDSLTKELYSRGESDRVTALVKGYNEVMNLLAAFTSPVNNTSISQINFSALIRIDMRNKALRTIPLKVDSVEMISPKQAYMSECRAMFILGASSDNFPYTGVDEGLMTAGELKMISESCGIFLPDKAENNTRSEFVTAALLFASVTDRLYFVSDKCERQSSCEKFFAGFSNVVLSDCFKTSVYGILPKQRLDHKDAVIDPENMDELIGDGMKISVSSLETFNTCPMQYMLRNVIGIDSRKDGTAVQANSMGSIIHAMFEIALKDTVRDRKTPGSITELYTILSEDKERLREYARQTFIKYCDRSDNEFEKTPEYQIFPGLKAMRIFSVAFPAILREIGQSGYVPEEDGFELNLKTMDPKITFTSDRDKEFTFVGSIDRVDTDAAGGTRIIDYKTGDKKIELDKTLQGLQIQLWAYADALEENTDRNVNDVGYFEIGLGVDKDGKPLDLHPCMAELDKEDFDLVRRYVRHDIQRSVNRISEGVCSAMFNKKSVGRYTPCEYCIYFGACGNSRTNPDKFSAVVPKKITDDKGKITDEDPLDTMRRIMKGKEGPDNE